MRIARYVLSYIGKGRQNVPPWPSVEQNEGVDQCVTFVFDC